MSDPVSPSLKDLPKVNLDLKSELEGFKTVTMKKAETQEKNVLPTAEGISSNPILLDENSILFSYSVRSSVLCSNTWNSVHSLAMLCFSAVSDMFSSYYLVLHHLYVFFNRTSSCVVELKYSNKIYMYSVKHNSVFYSISGNKFRSLWPSSGQHYTTFKRLVTCSVCKFQAIYLHQCQYLLKILSFVVCDMIYYGFYCQRTVIGLKYKIHTVI